MLVDQCPSLFDQQDWLSAKLQVDFKLVMKDSISRSSVIYQPIEYTTFAQLLNLGEKSLPTWFNYDKKHSLSILQSFDRLIATRNNLMHSREVVENNLSELEAKYSTLAEHLGLRSEEDFQTKLEAVRQKSPRSELVRYQRIFEEAVLEFNKTVPSMKNLVKSFREIDGWDTRGPWELSALSIIKKSGDYTANHKAIALILQNDPKFTSTRGISSSLSGFTELRNLFASQHELLCKIIS